MAIWDYTPKGDPWTAVAIGVGLLVSPVVIPMIGAVAKPVLKGVMKTGLMLYEKGSEMVVECVEGAQDLVAEARSEVQAELTAAKEPEA